MEDSFTISGRPLAELRVIDLKDELEKRGLSKSGNKSTLIKRLEETLLVEQAASNHTEKQYGEQSAAETFSSPNIAMKETGNDLVAEYLRNQQEALQAAKKAKEQAIAGSSDSESGAAVQSDSVNGKPSQAPMEGASAEETEEGRAEGGGSDGSSPRSADSSSPHRDSGAKDEEGAGSRSRLEDDQDMEEEEDGSPAEPAEEEENGQDSEEEDGAGEDSSRDRAVELGSAAADDEVEIAAPPESVEEMMADHQGTTKGQKKTESMIESQVPEAAAENPEKPQRKRRWGSTRIGKRETVAISSDSLKDIVGSVKEAVEETLPEHKVELDYDEEQPESKRIVVSQDASAEEDSGDTEPAPQPSVKRIVVEEPSEQVVITKEQLDKRELVTDEGLTRCKSLSPARYEVSELIHVRCLTRPFTMKGLKDLLHQFGEFSERDFWIDNVKSHCIIRYGSKEEAQRAREGLHNVKWPPGNPKLLRVDYSTEEALERNIKGITTNATDARPKENREQPEPRRKESVKEERRGRSRSKERARRRTPTPSKTQAGEVWPKEREWDRDKNWGKGQSPPREDRQRRRRSPTPDRIRDGGYGLEAKPAKLLDDLFRKTKTTPCIYWLPLTEEQIRMRAFEKKQKAEERAERLRRLEEEERMMMRQREDGRGPARDRPRRRSPTPERFRRR